MASPTTRTLERLRREKYIADICERWIPHANKRADLFRMFDVLAVRGDVAGVLGIQTTSGTNHSSRLKKLLANPVMRTWLQSGNKAEVWSWSQDHDGRWQCRRAAIRLDALASVSVEEAPQRRRRRRDQQKELFDLVSPETHV